MDFGVGNNWSLLLHLPLLVLLLACGTSESQQLTTITQDRRDAQMHLGDPKTGLLFFTMEDMKVGAMMRLKFPTGSPPKSYFLPKKQADSIPFSLNNLHKILQTFSLHPDSAQAKTIEHLLRMCESPPIEGETKYCATSLESLSDLTRRFFDVSDSDQSEPGRLSLLRSAYLKGPRAVVQNFTIVEAPREVRASSMMGCHMMPYPYAVFYCHHQGGTDTVFRVLLGGETGDEVDAVVACHDVVSQWDPLLERFHKVRTPPGRPLCHFFPPLGNIVWVYDHTPTEASF